MKPTISPKEKTIEPKDGLMCGVCGGRIYLAKDEPNYRMCDCDPKDWWNFLTKGISRKPKSNSPKVKKEGLGR